MQNMGHGEYRIYNYIWIHSYCKFLYDIKRRNNKYYK